MAQYPAETGRGTGRGENHPGVAKIFKRIMEMYDTGRCTTISDEEMENLARRYLSELFVSEFDQLKQKAYKLAAHLAVDLARRPRSAPWIRP